MKSVPGANFTFDWCVNAGYRAINLNAYYPGDDVVDVVGVVAHDVGQHIALYEARVNQAFERVQ